MTCLALGGEVRATAPAKPAGRAPAAPAPSRLVAQQRSQRRHAQRRWPRGVKNCRRVSVRTYSSNSGFMIRLPASVGARARQCANASLPTRYLFNTSSRFISSLVSIVQAGQRRGVERRRRASTRRRRSAVLASSGVLAVVAEQRRPATARPPGAPRSASGRASSRRAMKSIRASSSSPPSFKRPLGQVAGPPRRTAGRSASPAPAAACWSARGGRCRSRGSGR